MEDERRLGGGGQVFHKVLVFESEAPEDFLEQEVFYVRSALALQKFCWFILRPHSKTLLYLEKVTKSQRDSAELYPKPVSSNLGILKRTVKFPNEMEGRVQYKL